MRPREQELICKAVDGAATPRELEELEAMANSDPGIRQELEAQQAAAVSLQSVGQPELNDVIAAQFWNGVYSRIECRAGWAFVIAGFLVVTGYTIYLVLTDPQLAALFRFGFACMFVGIALLISSVARHRRRQAVHDKYKEVVR